jgi:hypothetical protein
MTFVHAGIRSLADLSFLRVALLYPQVGQFRSFHDGCGSKENDIGHQQVIKRAEESCVWTLGPGSPTPAQAKLKLSQDLSPRGVINTYNHLLFLLWRDQSSFKKNQIGYCKYTYTIVILFSCLTGIKTLKKSIISFNKKNSDAGLM